MSLQEYIELMDEQFFGDPVLVNDVARPEYGIACWIVPTDPIPDSVGTLKE